jgi:predicted nucleotide-binding protein
MLGGGCNAESECHRWQNRVSRYLSEVFDAGRSSEFAKLWNVGTPWRGAQESQLGMLEGVLTKLLEQDTALKSLAPLTSAAVPAVAPVPSRKVFVVHGHDSEAKESVARFLERLGLEPIILHEQANEGRTVIEKFEAHSNVGFAVVLLTPDDVGAAKDKVANLNKRARQNVVLELGYFLGKLRRSHVCALYKSGVEIPSDYQGVLYTELDQKGAWRTSLAQELSNAGLQIDLKALLAS